MNIHFLRVKIFFLLSMSVAMNGMLLNSKQLVLAQKIIAANEQTLNSVNVFKQLPVDVCYTILKLVLPEKEWWHCDKIFEYTDWPFVQWNKSGSSLAVRSEKNIEIYNAETYKQEIIFTADSWIESMSMDSDGEFFAISEQIKNNGLRNIISVINKKTNEVKRYIQDFFGPYDRDSLIVPCAQVALNSNGDLLVVHMAHIIKLIDLTNDVELITDFNKELLVEPNLAVGRVILSSSGKRLACTRDKNLSSDLLRVCVFDIERNENGLSMLPKIHFDQNEDGHIFSISLNEDGKFLAIGSTDNYAHVYDVDDNKKIVSFKHDTNVKTVSLSSMGDRLATGTTSKFNTLFWVSIFDVKNQQKIASFVYNNVDLRSVELTSNGSCVAAVSEDNKIRIFTECSKPTLAQILLKRAFRTWLLVEKPDKKIVNQSTEAAQAFLLADIACKCFFSEEKTISAWNSFPKSMQEAIWKNMERNIFFYGKYTSRTEGSLIF